jgi:hypothetical protein
MIADITDRIVRIYRHRGIKGRSCGICPRGSRFSSNPSLRCYLFLSFLPPLPLPLPPRRPPGGRGGSQSLEWRVDSLKISKVYGADAPSTFRMKFGRRNASRKNARLFNAYKFSIAAKEVPPSGERSLFARSVSETTLKVLSYRGGRGGSRWCTERRSFVVNSYKCCNRSARYDDRRSFVVITLYVVMNFMIPRHK